MITISPAALDAAPVPNTVALLVTVTERLCQCACANASIVPNAELSFVAGSPVLKETTVFVPVTVNMTVVAPSCKRKASTQLLQEKFIVAFRGQTALPASVELTTEGTMQGLTNIKCGKSNTIAANTLLVATLTPEA